LAYSIKPKRTDIIHVFPIIVDLPKEVLLFNAVGLTTSVPTGVTKVSGHHSNAPAFEFSRQATKNLISSKKGLDDVVRLISDSHDFVVSAYVKVDKTSKFSKNTIMSINSPDGNTLYFFLAITSDWQTSRLNIEFFFLTKSGNPKTVRSKTPRKADVTLWHRIDMRVQDSEKLIRFYVDGKMIDVQKFDYGGFKVIPSNSQLRLAQSYEVVMEGEGEITNKFVGTLQDVKVSLGQSHTKCNSPTVAPLPCKCDGSGCIMDARRYSDGQQWNKDKCNVCKCKGSHVFCVHTCPVCRDGVKIHLSGETWHPSNDSCMNCKCESGQTKCSPPTCPTPVCNKAGYSGKTIVPKGQCCPICKEDQCKASKKVYSVCGCTKTCNNHHLNSPCGNKCTEGCFCSQGKVMSADGKCISPADCTCTSNGRTF
ncbi:hypothetical protein QZH41_018787, partial [Actinostola sp. cb2023]